MNILIIKLGAIGDVIRTTSILPGLKSKYKNCKIDWVTKSISFDVLKNNNLISNIYLINKSLLKPAKIKDFLVKSNKKYDLVISLDDDYDACELATKANAKKIIGSYLKNNEKTYTKGSSLWFDMGLISRFGKKAADEMKAKNRKTYQEIIYKILGLNYKKQEPILNLDKKSLQFAEKFIKKNKIKKTDLVIGINTGAGGRWEGKKLSIIETAQLIDTLNKEIKKIKIILFGGPEEKERNEKIEKSARTGLIDAGCNNSLMEFASLVNLCSALVTSDSLALHMGVALKKKIVCFFCPTPSAEIELYSRGEKILAKKGCLCCYKPKCDISPEWDINEIVSSVKKLI